MQFAVPSCIDQPDERPAHHATLANSPLMACCQTWAQTPSPTSPNLHGAEINHHQRRLIDGLPPEFCRSEAGASEKLLHSCIELGGQRCRRGIEDSIVLLRQQ